MTNSAVVASRVPNKAFVGRKALLISCASAALAAGAIAPQKARAQAFNANPTTAFGSVNYNRATAGVETVSIGGNNAVIDWAPNVDPNGAGNIDFLPAGRTATFEGPLGNNDFTVINRVGTTTPIEMNGRVVSNAQGAAAGSGGRIWFYSPGGILVGSTSVFDVGSLLLTANAPSINPDTGEPQGQFNANVDSTARVAIANGARINALAEGSYVALIAPRVEQHGQVSVNGSAAYVAGEQISMTINDGLFDIEVGVGSADVGNPDDPNDPAGIVHTGSTGGPASTGVGDNHRIYMVAVPKNEAMTMLLSGGVGFDATTAGVVNGEIVLSSGHNVLEADGSRTFTSPSSIQSNISIDGGLYLSDVFAQAAGNIFAVANEGLLSFSRDATLISFQAAGDGRAHVGAINGDVSIGRDLVLVTNSAGVAGEAVLYANANGSVFVGRNADVRGFNEFGQADPIAAVNADGGTISVIGATSLLATLQIPPFIEAPSDAAGGDINVLASNGGSFTTGSLAAHASGFGQDDIFGSGFAGDGFGGDINIVASSAGLITVNGTLQANADGYGGDALVSSGFAGFGQGGNVRVAGDGGTVTVFGNAAISATGQGGIYAGEGDPFDVVSGDGIGGWARFETTAPGSAISVGGDIITNANGFGGNGQHGGAGFGGGAGVQSFAGAIDVTGSITLNANGVGGDSVAGFGGIGGYGEGGSAYIQAELTNGPSASITGGDAFLDANGFGGDGGDGFIAGTEVNIAAGLGGTGHGGYYFEDIETVHLGGAFVLADAAGATVELGNLQLHAVGTGGTGGDGWTGQAGGAGGSAFGGTVQAGSFDPDQQGATLGSASFGNVTLDGSAHGGNGGAGDLGGVGAPDGEGGVAFAGGSYTCGEFQGLCGGAYFNAKGSVELGDLWMGAQAWGGDGSVGGLALGGIASIEVTPGSTLTSTADLELSAAAWGGYGNSTFGGEATGGLAEVLINDGSLSAVGRVYVDSGGVGGGAGVIGSTGGTGTGGDSTVEVLGGGSLTANQVLVWTPGYGGAGTVDGGDAIAGTGTITVSGIDSETIPNASTINANVVDVEAFALAGSGGTGSGGTGTGGDATITASAGGRVLFGSSLTASAIADGGAGLLGGGDATGGNATITADAATISGADTIIISARAVGGNGSGPGSGGVATAGDNIVTASNGGAISAGGFLNLNGSAYGGHSFSQGGNAFGGTSTITLDGGSISVGSIGNYANAWGGNGLTGGNGLGGSAAINFTENGGSLNVAGLAGIEAGAFGGVGIDNSEGSAGVGGTGTGNSATLVMNSGTMTVGSLNLWAAGQGGTGGNGTSGGDGGEGHGGDISIAINGGGLTSGAVTVNVRGIGGDGGTGSSGLGGNGGLAEGGTNALFVASAGTVDAASYNATSNGVGGWGGDGASGFGDGGFASGGSHTVTFDGVDSVFANGFLATSFAWGGAGARGGDAQGGTSLVTVNGTVTSGGGFQVTGQSEGGEGFEGAGGDATSGTATLDVNGTLNSAATTVGANAIGGHGTTTGGLANGGSATLNVNGQILGGTVLVSTTATGGNGGIVGGNATAGSSAAFINGLGNVSGTTVDASAVGGAASAGDGGDALSGNAQLVVAALGSLTSGDLTVAADATGGAGTTSGGDAAQQVEAQAQLRIDPTGAASLSGTTLISANATGGAATTGAGGFAEGGFAELRSQGGVTGTADLRILSVAVGGNGFTGGGALGGSSGLYATDGGIVSLNSANLRSSATGGRSTGANGADATGGTSEIIATGANSRITLANISPFDPGASGFDSEYLASALGFGGQSDGGQGIGGTGSGGRATVRAEAGGTIALAGGTGNLSSVVARGFGGASTVEGGSGGQGIGALAEVGADGGTLIAPNLLVSSYGQGGNSANTALNISGGDGIGGERNLFATNGGVLTIRANGGGPGGIGGNGSGTGSGGDGIGGDARLDVDNGLVELTGNLSVFSQTGGGTGATGGDAGGGSAVISVINGGQIVDLVGTSTLILSSGAFGGTGTVQGGSGNASTVTLAVDAGSSINVGTLNVSSTGVGGLGPNGGAGAGGTAEATLAGSLTAGSVNISATGTGGDGANFGGSGTGGSARLIIASGGSAMLDSLNVGSDAFGGNSTNGFGGSAFAQLASVEASGNLTVTGETFVSAEGEGGDGLLGGGDGIGGDAGLWADSGAAVILGIVTNVETEGTGGASTNGTGGSGVGGYAHVQAFSNSSLSANNLTVASSGEGGSGVNGGSGEGRFPNIEVPAGSIVEANGSGASLTLNGTTTIESRGEGGAGTSGPGGNGTGGYASLAAIEGAVDAGNIVVDVTGLGGSGTPSGIGQGGEANINAQGGVLTAAAITMTADGSTDGGTARMFTDTFGAGSGSIDLISINATTNGAVGAGDILIDAFSGTMDLGVATLTSNGGAPGTDEDGIELSSGGTLTASQITMASTDGIRISTLNGGTIGVSGMIDADSQALIRLLNDGGGGAITSNTLDLAGADISFTATVQAADILLTLPGDYAIGQLPAATNGLSITAGGNITADAGVVYGSSLFLNAGVDITTADVGVAGELEMIANGNIDAGNLSSAGDLDLEAGGDIGFGNVDAGAFEFDAAGAVTGGNIVADTTATGDANGAIALGDITVGPGPEPADDFSVAFDSLTSIEVGDVQSYGRVGFTTPGGLVTGDIGAGSLVMMLVGGDISAGSITTAATGNVYIGDDSMFGAAGGAPGNAGEDNFDVSQVLAGAPVPTGGSITINGPVATGSFRAAAGTDLTAGAINADAAIAIRAGGVLTTGDLVAGTIVTAQSGGNLQVGNATAGTSIDLNSGGNLVAGFLDAPLVGLTVAGDFTTGDLFVDNSLSLTAGGDLTAGNIFAGGDLSLTAGLDLLALDLTAGGDLTLNAGGTLAAGDLSAGGAVAAGAVGNLTVGDVVSGFVPVGDIVGQAVVASGQNVLLSAGGNLSAQTISSAEGIALDAGGTLTTGNMDAVTTVEAIAGESLSVLGVDAGTSATFTAGGLASFGGTVSAPEITVTSGDISIADEGALGALGVTNLITLNAAGGGSEVILGGDGTEGAEGQYQLAEDGDIVSDAVVLNAAGNIRVLDAEIDGSQNSDGGVGHVTVNSGANVFVEGQVNFSDAAATDTLAMNAGQSIQIATDSGGIAMTDSSGDLSGILQLTAHDIWVADQATLDQIATDPTFGNAEDLLSVNNGPVNPAGNIQAGALSVTMLGSSFLVQNSGSDTEPAGLTVGQGGLSIVNNGAEPATVIIYGRQQGADGSILTGDAFFEEVEFAGTGGFTDSSNVNGCEVTGGCSPDVPEEFGGGVESILGPIGLMNDPKSSVTGPDDSTTDEEEEEEGEEEGEGGVDAGSSLINTGPVSIDQPIEEPVTSGSDVPTGTN